MCLKKIHFNSPYCKSMIIKILWQQRGIYMCVYAYIQTHGVLSDFKNRNKGLWGFGMW